MRLPIAAVAAAVLAGAGYGVVARLLFADDSPLASNGPMTFAFVVLVPLAVGFVAVAFGGEDVLEHRSRVVLLPVLTVIACLIYVTLSGMEGIICVVMLAPLFLLLATLGGMWAAAMHRNARSRRVHASAIAAVLLLPYAAAPLESRIPLPDTRRTVENRIRIRAEAQTVWGQIIRVPAIRPEEYRTSFIHRIGFPRPIEATLSHEGIGGVRQASFERGVMFRETVVEWEPRRLLSFTIAVDSIPRRSLDEHVTVGGDYFDVLDGTYEIVPIGGGGVELRLRSTHRLSTHFNPYAALWTDLVMRQVQGNILHVVRARAERVAEGGR